MNGDAPAVDLARPEIRQRNLPHWESAGATYFITFRTADSLPAGIIREIEIRQQGWLRAHGLKTHEEMGLLPPSLQFDYQKLINQQEEQALNAGHGACPFRNSIHRDILASLLHSADRSLYHLDHFVIMPNHVHLLVMPISGNSLGQITGSWKKHSARLVNASLGRTGRFWQAESFDHIVRGSNQLDQYRRYIADNPRKARLRAEEYSLGRGHGIAL